MKTKIIINHYGQGRIYYVVYSKIAILDIWYYDRTSDGKRISILPIQLYNLIKVFSNESTIPEELMDLLKVAAVTEAI